MFNTHSRSKNKFMLEGSLAKHGYDRWWHSFTAKSEKTGEERAFFIEFFACNPKFRGEEAVLGQLEENLLMDVKPSYLMIKVGCWGRNNCQLNKFYGWKQVKMSKGSNFRIKAGGCYMSETELRGSVEVSIHESLTHPEWMSDAGSIQWNLKITKDIAFNVGYGTGAIFRALKAFETYWHAEGMKSMFEGTIIYNGERYAVTKDSSYGYADKNWGTAFISPWLWLSSNCIKSNISDRQLYDTVFNIGGGRPKAFFKTLNRRLIGALWYEGKPYEFNFSKWWTHLKSDFSCTETDSEVLWHVRLENNKNILEVEAKCQKLNMILINYEDPAGEKRHNRLWNGGNGTAIVRLYEKKKTSPIMIDSFTATHLGCKYGEFD